MRRVLPTDFEVTHFGWWRGTIAMVAVLAASALAFWGWRQRGHALAMPAAALGVVALVGALSVAGRQGSTRLRWDGEHWYVDSPGDARDDPQGAPHRLVVAIDLGPWMLLKFLPVQAPGVAPARSRWLPVQRQGHEGQWHGMRRAVYFPRSSVGGPSLTEPHSPE